MLEHGPNDRDLSDVLAGLDAVPPNEIVRASREIAAAARLGWRGPRYGFALSRVFRKLSSEEDLLSDNPQFGWLFLFHPSGYVREAALAAIETPPTSPFFFAALAWRLNDWVAPVRQAAKRCAESVLPLTASDVAARSALYLLGRRFAWGRWSHEPDVLDAAFGRKDVAATLAVQLRDRSSGPLATTLRLALRYSNMDEHLPDLASHAVQPAVRAVAYQCLLSRTASWPAGYEWMWIDKVYGLRKRVPKLDSRELQTAPPIAGLIRQGIQDRSPKVRRVAADALIDARAHLSDADRLIGQLAEDKNSAVRSRADYMLRNPITQPA